MNANLDTLATTRYVRIDDALKDHPAWAPERPAIGIPPKLTDAELILLRLRDWLGSSTFRRFVKESHQ